MANIRNSIHLQDRMTPVFRSIIRSMDSTLKAMQHLDKQANNGIQSKAYRRAEKDIQRANNQLVKMKNHTDQATRSFDSLTRSTNSVSNNMGRINRSGFNLINLSSALYLFKNIKQTLSEIMRAPDEAISTKARFGLFNESQVSDSRLYEEVYRTALKTRTGIEETGNLATRILISGAMSGPGAAVGAIKVTDLINKSLVAGGGTAEENKRALLQLSQGLASGSLQGDELRAIREQTPYLAKIMAEGLGKVDPKFAGITIGDLKELGGDGELTSERIIKAFLLMENEINNSFEKMPRTFGQAMTQVNSVWKYFLYMLNQGDGALAKINQKAWEFADYLASSQGDEFLREIAMLFTIVADSAIWMIDRVVEGLNWLREHSEVAKAAFIALGVVAAIAGTMAFVAWVAATWPILLVAAAVGLVSVKLMEMGFTAGEIIGGIVGGVMWLGAAIWDTLLFIIGVIFAVIALTWNIIQGVGMFIYNTVIGIGAIFGTVFWGIIGVVAIVMDGIVVLVESMVIGVLKLLRTVATGIDFIFGSNLADGVSGWIDSVGGLADKIHEVLDPDQFAILQEDIWKDAPWAKLDQFAINPSAAVEGMMDMNLFLDPMDGWDAGTKFGTGVDKYFEDTDFTMGIESIESLLGKWDMNSVKMNGGDLDSIGKIKGDVNISDEDLQLLRDISAREFLLNLTSVTPQAHVQFGDVRETADVYKIMEVIEDMVEEALATSLITD